MKTFQFISMPEEQHEVEPEFFLEREDSRFWLLARINFRQGILIVGLVFLLCGLRFLHLDADTPIWLKTFSMGEYVDEGYKTLSPRNLALFGRTHWHPLDNYPGWMQSSPITSWSNYAAFKLFGPRLEAARFVTILFFTGFLLAYFFTFRGRYSAPVLVCGLLLLGLAPALFLFSRIALFETPIIFFVYGWMFLLTRQKEESIWMPIAGGILVAALIAFGIKFSALIYIGPMLVMLLVRAALLRRVWSRRKHVMMAAVTLLAIALLAFVTRPIWLARFDPDPVAYVMRILSSPLVHLSPFLLLGGWLCALYLVIGRPSEVLASPYLTALLALALLGPLTIGLFPYNPTRYYIPILPAYALITCEWLTVRGQAFGPIVKSKSSIVVVVVGLAMWCAFAARTANQLILRHLPISGKSLAIGDPLLVYLTVAISFFMAGAIWVLRPRLLQAKFIAVVIAACGVLFFLNSGVRLVHFAASPSYQSRTIRAALVKAMPAGSSVIGDWAPFFALGTDLRPLYMNDAFNSIDQVPVLRPDYFLYCDSLRSPVTSERFNELKGLRLGVPILTAKYAGRSLALYRIYYGAEAITPSPSRLPRSMVCKLTRQRRKTPDWPIAIHD